MLPISEVAVVRIRSIACVCTLAATVVVPAQAHAGPTPCGGQSPDERTPRPSALRRFLGAAIPTVYIRWRSLGGATATAQRTPQPPASPKPAETTHEMDPTSRWAIGIRWDVLDFFELEAPRSRGPPARHRTNADVDRCRRLLREMRPTTFDDTASFEEKLERAIFQRTMEALQTP